MSIGNAIKKQIKTTLELPINTAKLGAQLIRTGRYRRMERKGNADTDLLRADRAIGPTVSEPQDYTNPDFRTRTSANLVRYSRDPKYRQMRQDMVAKVKGIK